MFRHMELKRSKKMCDMDCMVTMATMYGHMHIYIYIQIHACTFHYTPRNITIYNLYILYIIYYI